MIDKTIAQIEKALKKKISLEKIDAYFSNESSMSNKEREAYKITLESKGVFELAQRFYRLREISKFLHEELKLGDKSDINSQTRPYGWTPLIRLIHQVHDDNKHMRILEYLISEPTLSINLADFEGKTPIYHATATGNLSIIKLLNTRNPNYRKATNKKKTPLSKAVSKKLHQITAFIVEKLVGYSLYSSEAYENHEDQYPIHNVCIAKHELQNIDALVQLFKDSGVNLNMRDDNYFTPLMVAAYFGNVHTIIALLSQGADPTLVDHDGRTFLDILDPSLREELLKLIKDKNLDINLDWYNDIYQIKRYGHILGIGSFLNIGHIFGLGGKIRTPITTRQTHLRPISIYTEGWLIHDSYQAITDTIKRFKLDLNENPQEAIIFEKIQESYRETKEVMIKLGDNPKRAEREKFLGDIAAQHAQAKLITIPVRTETHAFGLAIYKDKLIFTDRFLLSGKRFKECTTIFQLKGGISLNEITNFLRSVYCDVNSADELQGAINGITQSKPIMRLGDSAQTHGTCSYSNPRSNIEGILTVLKADNPNISTIDPDAVKQCKQQAHSSYCQYLYASRRYEIESLIANLKNAVGSNNSAKAKMYYQLADSYIRGHHNKRKNDGTDWAYSIALYQAFPPEYKKRFTKVHPGLAIRFNYDIRRMKKREQLRTTRQPTSNLPERQIPKGRLRQTIFSKISNTLVKRELERTQSLSDVPISRYIQLNIMIHYEQRQPRSKRLIYSSANRMKKELDKIRKGLSEEDIKHLNDLFRIKEKELYGNEKNI